ncbi:hypothetical protein ACQI4F_01965 [Mycolicibacterium vaccae]|uniref:hypothetical protein n=1 Tax=Mycolicibacterium vaccae TaxID=1810 RepID=UPI003CEABADF
MHKEAQDNFYGYTFGTDDPNIQYVEPDGYAPNVAIRIDGQTGTRLTRMAKVLVSATGDFDDKVIEGYLYMNAAQLRKLGTDALQAAYLLDE